MCKTGTWVKCVPDKSLQRHQRRCCKNFQVRGFFHIEREKTLFNSSYSVKIVCKYVKGSLKDKKIQPVRQVSISQGEGVAATKYFHYFSVFLPHSVGKILTKKDKICSNRPGQIGLEILNQN